MQTLMERGLRCLLDVGSSFDRLISDTALYVSAVSRMESSLSKTFYCCQISYNVIAIGDMFEVL